MGWSIFLNSDKEITYDEAKTIVENLPKKLRGPWEEMGRRMDQAVNGWNAGCDIHYPKGTEWRIGGSYGSSGHIAEEMAKHLRNELQSLNHKIKLKKNL